MNTEKTLLKKIVSWLTSHLLLIGLIIFGIGLFLSSCGKAKAEDFSSEFWESVQSDLSVYNSSNSFNDVYNAYMNSCSNYGLATDVLKYVRFPLNNDVGVLYLFAGYEHAVYCSTQSFSGDLAQYYFVLDNYSACDSYTLTSDDNGHRFFALFIVRNNSVCFGNHRTQGTISLDISYINNDYSSDVLSIFHRSTTNTFDVFYGQGSYYNQFNLFNDDIVAKGDNYFVDYNYKCIYYSGESINWVEDDRLSIYTTYNVDETKNLNIDLSKFREIPNVPNLSFVYSDLNIILNCDSVDVPFVLDGNNSKIVDILSNTNNVYTVITNYNIFGLDSYFDVYISSVSFSLTTNLNGDSYTENYNILCHYDLKYSSSPIVPDDITWDDSIYQDIKSTAEIQQLIDDLQQSSSGMVDGIFGDYEIVINLSDIPSWAQICEFSVWENKEWITELGGNSYWKYTGDWYYKGHSDDLQSWYIDFPYYDFTWQNAMFAYYDVIAIYLGEGEGHTNSNGPTGFPDNMAWAGYVVFYSQRYYIREDAFTNLDILTAIQNDANQSIENWTYLTTRLDDFEEKTLEALVGEDSPLSVFYNLNKLDTDILSSVTRIIDSIPEFEPFDGSDILAMVTSVNGYCQDIAGNTASGNTVLSSILLSIQSIETLMGNNFSGGYRQYMVWLDESIDDLELIETPKEFAGRMFNITKDVFYGLVAFNPFFEDIENFVDIFYPIDRAGHSFSGKSLFFEWQNDYDPHSYTGV